MILTPPVWRPPRGPWRCHAARIPQLLIAFATVAVSGCTKRGAPTFAPGHFFPDRMLVPASEFWAAVEARGVGPASNSASGGVRQQLLCCVSAGLDDPHPHLAVAGSGHEDGRASSGRLLAAGSSRRDNP